MVFFFLSAVQLPEVGKLTIHMYVCIVLWSVYMYINRAHTNAAIDMCGSAFTTESKNLTSLFTMTLLLEYKLDTADLSPGFE